MKFLKKLSFTLNVVWLITLSILLTAELDNIDRWKWEEWILAVVGMLTPLFTCYYFMNIDDSKTTPDSLLSLWIKVKKKKLNDQLK